jgi:hypothetical protein
MTGKNGYKKLAKILLHSNKNNTNTAMVKKCLLGIMAIRP